MYNIIVPTAQEFYASNSKKTNQTAAISDVYEHIIQYNKKNLKPINIVQTLYDHAAEKIYFCTDHHWTQRGAYYAYQKYALENKSIPEIDPLNTFEVQNIYGTMVHYVLSLQEHMEINCSLKILTCFSCFLPNRPVRAPLTVIRLCVHIYKV